MGYVPECALQHGDAADGSTAKMTNLTNVGSCEAGRGKLDSCLSIFQGTFCIAQCQSDPAPVCMKQVLPLRQIKIYSFAVSPLRCL